jgi:hypothetical protein
MTAIDSERSPCQPWVCLDALVRQHRRVIDWLISSLAIISRSRRSCIHSASRRGTKAIVSVCDTSADAVMSPHTIAPSRPPRQYPNLVLDCSSGLRVNSRPEASLYLGKSQVIGGLASGHSGECHHIVALKDTLSSRWLHISCDILAVAKFRPPAPDTFVLGTRLREWTACLTFHARISGNA